MTSKILLPHSRWVDAAALNRVFFMGSSLVFEGHLLKNHVVRKLPGRSNTKSPESGDSHRPDGCAVKTTA